MVFGGFLVRRSQIFGHEKDAIESFQQSLGVSNSIDEAGISTIPRVGKWSISCLGAPVMLEHETGDDEKEGIK